MAKFFTFPSNVCSVQFFDGKEAVKISLIVGDKTDKKLVDAFKAIAKAESCEDGKYDAMYEAVSELIGKGTLDAILDKCPDSEADSFRIMQIFAFVRDAYREAKAKNLSGSPVN